MPPKSAHGNQDSRINPDLSAMRPFKVGNHANRCLPVLLRMRKLQNLAPSKGRRLLRLLLVWLSQVPTYSRAARVLLLTGNIQERPQT